MTTPIINKVSESGLITLDLETYFPKNEIMVFDLKPMLFMELILKEKDFRQSLQTHDWAQYQDKIVAVTCTADAIIPVWAYMLVASNLQPYAKDVILGTEEEAQKQVLQKRIQELNPANYQDQRVVVKGCGELEIGPFAYLEVTKLLRPVAKSIMYGEPCSTVPVFKKK